MHNPGNPVPAVHSDKMASSPSSGTPPDAARQMAASPVPAALTAVLALCFICPLCDWMRFSVHSQFYSYMPVMSRSGYLIWSVAPAWSDTAEVGGLPLLLLLLPLPSLRSISWPSAMVWPPNKTNCA